MNTCKGETIGTPVVFGCAWACGNGAFNPRGWCRDWHLVGCGGNFSRHAQFRAAYCDVPEIQKSRADRIRTCDLFVPNEARYQPALQLDVVMTGRFYIKNQDLQA